MVLFANQHYAQLSGGEQLTSVYKPSFIDIQADESMGLSALGSKYDAQQMALEMDDLLSQKDMIKERMLEEMDRLRAQEYARGLSLVGPQRDDINFFINGTNARSFASQGQQRSIALALKLAEVDVIKEISGDDPLLLLDDVFSELDDERRERLLLLCDVTAQNFITTTDLRFVPEQYQRPKTMVELTRQI
jgi:DNA replication and repair protein RecF